MIPILILAAGSSSRMRGRDKLMEDVGGIPLLRQSVLRARATGNAVYVALPVQPHIRFDALTDLDVTHVPVPEAAEGMNASLRAGLAALPSDAQAVMVLLADMPDIMTKDMNTILQTVDFNSDILIWRATTQSGSAGHPIVFHADLFPALMALQGDEGGKAVVQENRARTRSIPLPDDHARTDLDTPEAWDAWRNRQAST